MSKICSKCQIEKSDSEFYSYNKTRDGLSGLCKKCNRERVGRWKKKNRDKVSMQKKRYYQKNKEKMRERSMEYLKEYSKEYYQNNKERIRNRRRINRKGFRYRLDHNMAVMVGYTLKTRKIGKNGRRWRDLIGYTLQDLMQHIEAQFTPEMTWDNYGLYWEIDHIIPKSWFDFESSEDSEFQECWSLENLQPLEVRENHSKGNRVNINEFIQYCFLMIKLS